MCVIYKGPDKRYKGREICIGSNETAISLAGRHRQDERRSSSRARRIRTSATRTRAGSTEDAQYFYLNDELDEGGGNDRQDAHADLGFHRSRESAARQGALRRRGGVRSQPVHQGRPDVSGELPRRPARAEHQGSRSTRRRSRTSTRRRSARTRRASTARGTSTRSSRAARSSSAASSRGCSS